MGDKELNAEKLKSSQGKEENWKRCKQHEQGSKIEVLALNGRQKKKLSG
jgi:hypothetical protein